MKYKCLVFDHDDTVVNSTATIHHPCFESYLNLRYPGQHCTLENYFMKNFEPGFLQMCREEYGMDDAALDDEFRYWQQYVAQHIPTAYPGIAELMHRHKDEGGYICVVSHSVDENIRRDYEANGLPQPDAVYGWEQPPERRKPEPWPLQEIMRRFELQPNDLLMIDDLKPGYDMAKACKVDFAAAGWAYDLPQIESFMRKYSDFYFKTVHELADFLEK